MNKILVFIGAPYSKPSMTLNVNKSAAEFDWIWQNLGDRCIPESMVVSSHMQDLLYPRHYEDWTRLCIEKLKKCDILYLLPGESSGKREEIKVAKAMGIPIVESREALIEYMDEHPELFDGEVARLRREIGQQLYAARRQGVDLASVGVQQAAHWIGVGGRTLVKGATGVLSDILTGSMSGPPRRGDDRRPTGDDR